VSKLSKDVRERTLALALATAGKAAASPPTPEQILIDGWLGAIEEDDLAGISPDSLAPILWDGFSRFARRPQQGCQIETMRYTDIGRGHATALLIVNPDMPFLIDSFVMAVRKMRVTSRAVINAVLSVRRAADGTIEAVARAHIGTDPLESYVLFLLTEEVKEQELAALTDRIRMVAGDAAAVQHDAEEIAERMLQAGQGAAAIGPEGTEVAAFLDWAASGGLELFGYAYYRAVAADGTLVRDIASRIGVLRDARHQIYDKCLAGVPEDYDSLALRPNILSVVKADAQSTLHRDQQLDFIGVRDVDAKGVVLGEHCFLGLFSRTAMATPLAQLPFVRGRVQQVLALAGVRQHGFRAEKFLEILESLPRTEVFEAAPEWLTNVCSTVVALYKQPRAMVSARPDVYGRHLNVLVYMPRERYGTHLAARLSKRLRSLSGATDVRTQTLLAEGPLARVYLIATGANLSLDLYTEVEQPLLAVVEGWHTAFDHLVDSAPDVALRASLRKLRTDLPAEYLGTTSPKAAYEDLIELLDMQPARVKVHIETSMSGSVNIRLLSINSAPSLSRILPALQNAGVAVDREQTYQLAGLDDMQFFVASLTVDSASAEKLSNPEVADAAEELFEALLNNEAEDGRMNGLVIEAGLRLTEVQVIRAYASYMRQAGSRFSLRYIADCLRKQPEHVRILIESFLLRFDPDAKPEERVTTVDTLATLKQGLIEINHADTEDILRNLANLILATLRTSYYQDAQTGDTIIFKFDTTQLKMLPEPRPHREIFVFSRRFEGLHLRGGQVARGGLRWSDRMEDYRTEVLGLVKAQMVKNAVIVPVGAKGGFVCKMMPKDAARDVVAAEGEAVYRLFIAALLDMTDNRVRGEIVQPPQTICSDIANGIAVKRGFWLGDAFASGGSNGYDHKKLGITAKGAWESVKRHFYEMGHDIKVTPITMVGIGDMSGDVFGNGALRSRLIRLVSAFDHRHIFIDPSPDLGASFDERKRLFGLPRSSWDDYDKKLISKGGGVWPRTARTIPLSEEARAVLGTDAIEVTPEELMHIILRAPVDLFYNGGIGTYIKASTETHTQVKDRANDQIRVDGNQLRCKVVAEGGNLGATQAGRIEFALRGGHIFTDAIDNSAGVDCSDHEVNVKIWLDTEVNAGQLTEADRNHELFAITDDIEALVLRDNTLQTHLLVREIQAQSDGAVLDGYAALIASLEAEGVISRELEQLPTETELARRKAEGTGLTAPELAVVMAHVKNRYKRILAALPLTQNTWARTVLTPYFAPPLVATRNPLDHPLANAILATVLANEVINRCGPLMIRELANTQNVAETDVITAWAQAWAALNLAPLFEVVDTHAMDVPCEASRLVDQRTRALQRAVVQGALSVPSQQLHDAGGYAELTRLFSQTDVMRQLVPASIALPYADADFPTEFRQACQTVEAIEGMANFLFAALTVTRPDNTSLPDFLQIGMSLRRHAGIDTLEHALMHMSVDASQEPLRAHALQSLRRAQQNLLKQVMHHLPTKPSGAGASDLAIANMVRTMHISPDAHEGTEEPNLEQAVLKAWMLSEKAAGAAADKV
jgi:glutamate dehydrogenase